MTVAILFQVCQYAQWV